MSTPIPRAIANFENLIWKDLSMRDVIVIAAVALVAALVSRIPPNPVAQLVVAALIAIPGLVLSLYHLVSDADRIEVILKRKIAYHSHIHDLTWRKEYEDIGDGYMGDTTQSVFPRFTVDENGYLRFDRSEGGGGAALIAIEASDYVMRRGDEQRATIGGWYSFLEGIARDGIPVQVVVKSVPLDLSGEIEGLTLRRDAFPEGSALRRAAEFHLEDLDELQNGGYVLFEKRYYMVIPYLPGREGAGRASLGYGVGLAGEQLKANNPLSRFLKRKQQAAAAELDLSVEAQTFDPSTTTRILRGRVDTVLSLLRGIEGLSARVARGEEYVELMYYFFNPGDSKLRYVLDNGIRQNLVSRSPEMEAMMKEIRPAAAAAPQPSRPSSAAGEDLMALLARR